jgi:hypothetical protein
MRTYDYTLSTDTINLILRGLKNSPDINKPGSRDYTRALQLLDEKKKREQARKAGRTLGTRYIFQQQPQQHELEI